MATKRSMYTGIIVILILLGYIFILYSVLVGQPVNCEKKEMLIEPLVAKVEDAAHLQEIEELKNKIAALELSQSNNAKLSASPTNTVRQGVIILGMHRSGTSVVGGLINKMGLNTGGPLIMPANDNEKGFFERIDVVLQNDYLMRKQNVHYSLNTYKFDALVALKHILTDDGSLFKEGKRGLLFLNQPSNYPWMLKDPRLCITFRTWLPLLNFVPAVLFTYRHPIDVAMSLNKRENEHFRISKSLRMWYVYNRRAIEQSHDLCRVVSSHSAIMTQPQVEMDRIHYELLSCGVPVPHKLSTTDVASFVDPSLQHGKSALLKDASCSQDLSTIKPPSVWPTEEPDHIALYRKVMTAFCAMEDRSAFQPTFQWDKNIIDD